MDTEELTGAGNADACSDDSTGLETLLQELTRLDVRLSADGDQLGIHAPRGALTRALRERLGRHKDALLAMLRRGREAAAPAELPALVLEPERRHEPFPLTDVQHAYWLGRDSALEMGNVATHLYVELDCEPLDVARLNDALCRMIDRHDMLRAVVAADGTQHILASVPRYQIAVSDQTAAPPGEAERAIEAVRAELSHQVLRTDRWPLFEIRATLLPQSRLRLHVSLDLLILDAWSIFLFFREWHQFYAQPQRAVPALGLSFRDYVLAEKRHETSDAWRRAHAYWMERIDSLPAAPDLPLHADPATRQSPRFRRREARIPKQRWDRLKVMARANGLTPSGVLLAAYSEVLARWSGSPHFTLNLTVSNRLPLHADVNSLLGDFTSLVLQEVDRRDHRQAFVEFARRLQQQFARDLEHREVSGVAVMREWAKRRGTTLQAAMPVVFSSGLIWTGDEEVGDLEQFGRKVHSISQTSQVWLDHHVMELQGDLHFVWDAAEAVFEDGVLDAMFAAYCDLIGRLADDPGVWGCRDVVPLPLEMTARRVAANRTSDAQPQRPLHAGFVTNALQSPQSVAIHSPERTMTYGELLAESAAVADRLLANGLRPGQLVAVLMHKGWEQVVAVCGVLLAGGAYLPVDANLPVKRQLELLRLAGTRQVLTQPGVLSGEVAVAGYVCHEVAGARGQFGKTHQRSLEVGLDSLAYVIFTSGTTGVPKGVMIDHRGAMNTVMHINRLYRVGREDRVLAVSSLSFDLSVYDIFGLLDAGGSLVLPDYRKGHDPMHWRELLARHGVTLWNSAPQLMRMLMDSFAGGDGDPAPLRTVLLSGDFIPLDLPERVRARYPEAQVVSLGGATEASIWSIYYPIATVDPAWTSIPYGKPLPNQTVWVCDSAFRVCPDHVRGRIFIGGIGLAHGYWRDADKTAARFVSHPESGERLYDTGDLGRYAPDGNVQILGRDDGQIKIRGHRIELGEIEALLRQHPGVRQAIVLPTAGPQESRQLVAYVVSGSTAGAVAEPVPAAVAEPAAAYGFHPDPGALRDYLADRLPDYMVPRHVVEIDHVPVSANGKIDHRALPAINEDDTGGRREVVPPRDEAEQAILDAWSRIIVGCEIGVTDNFFELGGDSVLATQLIRELNAALPAFRLEMHELFENLTIESLATLYRSRAVDGPVADTAHTDAPRRAAEAPSVNREALAADLNAAIARIETIDFGARPRGTASAPEAVLLTGGTGWIGSHVLAELLTQTDATVYCLVRGNHPGDDRARLFKTMRDYGVEVDPVWRERVKAVRGDLAEPKLGLDAEAWRRLAVAVDAIYHLAASVNVLADYSTHSKTNVNPVVTLVRMAAEHHRKPVFFASPMTVCRRHKAGRLVILHDECSDSDPDGLLTGYAQSKWAAEQVLLAAGRRGLPVKIYRSSHALPSARNGLAKPNDTYGSVLKVACEAGVVPDWTDSRLHGVPVDILARLMVENSLRGDDHSGVIHLENRDPLNFTTLLQVLLNDEGAAAPLVPLGEWKRCCLEAATRLSGEGAGLARVLFADREHGAAIENMFAAHPIDTGYFDRCGQTAKLNRLTPPEYWARVRHHPRW